MPAELAYDSTLRRVALIVTLAACVWAISPDRRHLLMAGLLSLAPISAQFFPSNWSQGQLWISGAFFLYVTLLILSNVFSASEINADKIFGATCAYLLVGLVFAHIYLLIELTHPGTFKLDPQIKDPLTIFDDLLYFSMVTMTTVGYGDIVPLTRPARSLATMEAVFGQFYIAVLVGRLLGLYMEFHGITSGRSDRSN
ncbi:MAG: hypothetical protein AMXMBFR33_05630 [Candidatus Xenobia bacterium]